MFIAVHLTALHAIVGYIVHLICGTKLGINTGCFIMLYEFCELVQLCSSQF